MARSLGLRRPRVLQSMAICKPAGIGGAVPAHQDSTFLYTDPPSALGFWYALEDAAVENGCLSFAAGSHRRVPVRKRFVRTPSRKVGDGDDGMGKAGTEDTQMTFRPLRDGERGFPQEMDLDAKCADRREDSKKGIKDGEGGGGGIEKEGEAEYSMGPVRAGSLVLIHGNLLHKSERNLSGSSRFIYTFHVIEGDGSCSYDAENWLQPPVEKDGSKSSFTSLYDETP